jgi:hypothetical protein
VGRECLWWWCGKLRFDLSDELYAETVLKHSTRLVPRGAAAWSASSRNRLRNIMEEKKRLEGADVRRRA